MLRAYYLFILTDNMFEFNRYSALSGFVMFPKMPLIFLTRALPFCGSSEIYLYLLQNNAVNVLKIA